MLLLVVPRRDLNFTGETRPQSVTQPEALIEVLESAPLELKCTYSYTGFLYFFWYALYPNQEPQLLLKSVPGSNLVKCTKGFEAELNKGKTSFHLKKPFAQGSDSAEYFCAVKTQ
uniref:Ig-like domain-containing protein n=1 Tax=Sarcophilus harrisii TaxID=9305 RepID=A0A7N4PDR9_SARHA